MFWPSVILFFSGVLLCQFWVLPGAVKALLKFNEFLGFDPDIRLNEWLGLAIILPLVFGLSFQTPLVMIFLNRIGVFSAKDYAAKWRYATAPSLINSTSAGSTGLRHCANCATVTGPRPV